MALSNKPVSSPMGGARVLLDHDHRQSLIETAVRGGLAVALHAVFPPFSDVYRLWRRAAGLVDWPDVFEYPPGAAVYIEPFLHLPSARWAVVANGLVMVLAAVIITHLLASLAEGEGGPVDIRVWVASPALLVFLPVNWDVLVVLTSLATALFLLRERHAWSGVTAGIGTVLKLFPGFLVLPFLAVAGRRRQRVTFLASGFVVVAVPYLISIAVDAGWRFHLDFASLRTDINFALWGPLVRLAVSLGFDVSIGLVNVVSTASLLVALLGVSVWAFWRKPDIARVAAITMLVVLFFIKVFKPQYVLWALPFLAWSRASRVPARILEGAAIVQLATTFFPLPVATFALVVTPIRLAATAWLVRDLWRVHEGKARGEVRTASA